MNELRNGCPSIVPRTFTRPRVPKNAAEPGMIKQVHAPACFPFRSFALNCFFNFVVGIVFFVVRIR
jgi:hypothetical protein